MAQDLWQMKARFRINNNNESSKKHKNLNLEFVLKLLLRLQQLFWIIFFKNTLDLDLTSCRVEFTEIMIEQIPPDLATT